MLSTRLSVRRVVVPALLLLVLAPLTAWAEAPQTAIDRAHRILSTKTVGVDVLLFLHMGTAYHGHTLTGTRNVQNEPNDFALVYRYKWGDDGVTDLAILCDETGNPYAVRVLYTNAILNQPFVVAEATIQIVGNLILEGFGKDMTDADRAAVRKAIDNADAKRLLVWYLQLRAR